LRFHLLLVLPLAHTIASAQQPGQRLRQRVQWFIYRAPTEWFGDSRQAIIQKLGSPSHISFTLNPNPQDTLVADSVFTFAYDSASFVVYAATRPSREFLVEASVSGPRYLRRSPLPFGTPMQTVRVYFADSSRAPTSTLVYSCPWCDDPIPGSTVALWFRSGRLVGLKWDYKID
jgi:hypothetical protein